ncbi:molybdopterin-dependent oxidoreductase [uncultured Jannaschia sp.]|uniref:molybdopterin-dependent oxidoreductase n=1 Tax=uncultured Jannaschia sp. TaxID=293347 RepID=UPI002614519D|nr:molybdopterin-dependent oxidoreductase [uncultured Jannaschia sp.]
MAEDGPNWGLPHSSHWGRFRGRLQGDRLEIRPHPDDPDPSPLLENFTDALRHRARVARPAIRRGWLERGPGPDDRRGTDEYVEVPWDEALDRLAAELLRVRDAHGAEAVFGGSYGWASAGRFHHVQGQLHRFLNVALGGYVGSVGSYSAGASTFLLPHVVGSFEAISRHNVTWAQIVEHTDLVIAFGGMAVKNTNVAAGGISRHIERGSMAEAAARGTRFVNVSPLRGDFPPEARAEWIAPDPGTDTAMMLAMMHVLDARGLADRGYLETHCVGADRLLAYVRGDADGVAKTPDWAAAITGLDAEVIAALSLDAAKGRTLITVSHSLQRAEHGEQPVWAGIALAAMLGQIGLPGAGYNYALGSLGHTGRVPIDLPLPTLPQGRNGVEAFIPCARISDMLLNPNTAFDFNGQRLTYPEIKLVYWAGGNPFHHHQDLTRLTRAFAGIDTLVVQDFAWTASARHADIVLPATMSLEREDIGAAKTDLQMVAMRALAEPFAEARDDFAIFRDLAARMDCEDAFTEGRDAEGWLRHLYEPTRATLEARGLPAPDFEAFRAAGEVDLPAPVDDGGMLRRFRTDPVAHPLPTPSGRIELYSETIAEFRYPDCPGHPAWLDRVEVPTSSCPLWLVSNQPATRLHSQLDFGAASQASKRKGREVAYLNPDDARDRGVADGDLIRISSDRGACLAAVAITDSVTKGVVNLPTGAWYDPVDLDGQRICQHGNPNAVTRDAGTSRLAQGSTGQLCCVQVEKWQGEVSDIRAFDGPR